MAPKDNPESWVRIHEFIAQFADEGFWIKWKAIATRIVSDLEQRGLREHFRIGQSMHHIILSTQQSHDLQDAPRVTLEIIPDAGNVRVAYTRMNLHFFEAENEVTLTANQAVPEILSCLGKLWRETKRGCPLPEGIEVAEPGATDNPGNAQ